MGNSPGEGGTLLVFHLTVNKTKQTDRILVLAQHSGSLHRRLSQEDCFEFEQSLGYILRQTLAES